MCKGTVYDHKNCVCVSLEIHCNCSTEELQNPKNGKYEIINTLTGSWAVYSCREGLTLTGDYKHIKCINGKWEGSPPTCEAGCPQPGKIIF